MKVSVAAISLCLFGLFQVGRTQFNNGRLLDAPNAQLCAQRILHEKTPDGKG